MKRTVTAVLLSAALVVSGLVVPATAYAASDAPSGLTETSTLGSHRFSWNAAPEASAYRIEISSDAGFGTTLEAVDTYSRTYVSRVNFASENDRTLYWRVAAYTSGVKPTTRGAWSSTQTLEVEASIAPSPLTPAADKAFKYPEPVTFTWSKIEGAVSYELQYAPGGDFQAGTTTTAPNLADAAYTPTAPLVNGSWEWRVRAKLFSHSSEALFTPWSVSTPFSVVWDAADSLVTQKSPLAAKTVSDPLFAWEPVAGASYYTVKASRNADMTNLLELSATGTAAQKTQPIVYGTSFVPDKEFRDGAYYWTVTAHDLAGREGALGEPQSFLKEWGTQPEADYVTGSEQVVPVTHQGVLQGDPEPTIPFNEFMLSWDPVPRATLYNIVLEPIVEGPETLNSPSLKPNTLECRTANTSATMLNVFNTGGSTARFKGVDKCFDFPLRGTDLKKYLWVLDGNGEPVEARRYFYTVEAIDYAASATTTIQANDPADTLKSNPSDRKFFAIGEKTSTGNPSVTVELDEAEFQSQWVAGSTTIGKPAPLLKWEAVEGATAYEVRVFRGTSVNDISDQVATFRTQSTVFQPNGVFMEDDASDQSYRYKVQALTGEQWGSMAFIGTQAWNDAGMKSVSWKRTTTPAAFPEDYSSTQNGAVLLRWTPQFSVNPDEGGSRGYAIRYRAKGSGSAWTQVKVEYPFWIPKQSNGAPLANGTYEFQVAPLDANGDAARYSEGLREFDIEPTKPTGLTATRVGSAAHLNWHASSVSEGYQLRYRKGIENWTTSPANALFKQTAAVVSPLIDSGDVEYQVRSQGKGAQWSQWSDSVRVNFGQASVVPTTADGAVLPTSNRVLSWQPVPGASRYLVQVASTSAGVATAPIIETVGTSYAPEKELNHGAANYWRVVAVSEYYNKTLRLENRVKLGVSPTRAFYVTTPPKAPTLKAAKLSGANQAQLSWDAPSAAAAGVSAGLSYVVRYRKADQTPAAAWSEKSVSGLGATGLTVTGLALSSNYEFQLSAKNSEGASAWSASRKVTTLALPVVPSGLKVVQKNDSAVISWKSVSGAKKYALEYRVQSKKGWSKWALQGEASRTSVTHARLVYGNTYQYRVASISAAGKSANSSTAQIRLAPPLPAKPTVKLKAAKGKTTISWTKPKSVSTPVTGYKIMWSTNKKTWKSLKTLSASKKSYIAKVGKKGKYVYFKVAAKNKYGFGAYSSVKKIKKK